MTQRCGCGKPAEYQVYEDKQPHCESCMKEAVDCPVSVLVEEL